MSKKEIKHKSDSKHQIEQASLDEYFSFVRHELRNQLLVIHEGISQVLDGLAGDDWNKCFEILQRALRSANKLNQLIEELIGASAGEKLENKRHGESKGKSV